VHVPRNLHGGRQPLAQHEFLVHVGAEPAVQEEHCALVLSVSDDASQRLIRSPNGLQALPLGAILSLVRIGIDVSEKQFLVVQLVLLDHDFGVLEVSERGSHDDDCPAQLVLEVQTFADPPSADSEHDCASFAPTFLALPVQRCLMRVTSRLHEKLFVEFISVFPVILLKVVHKTLTGEEH